jgi:hypothetical protein
MNFPWSQSNSSDDVWWEESSWFDGKLVVVTEKMDGEGTTIYPDGHVQARSVDSAHHPSRSLVKQQAATFAYEIPQGWRICGENLFAFHSIFYTDLPAFFLAYGIYDEENYCLAWDDVEELCRMLKIETVPVIYRGIWDEKKIREAWTGKGRYPTYGTQAKDPSFPDDFAVCEAEGYVVRLAEKFHYDSFFQSCAKYVRANHVQTDEHWMRREVIQNLLRN